MAFNLRFRFSPMKDGLVKVLGPLETEIMQILWQEGTSTVKKVHRKLAQQRDIAYTTVMTTMSRLADKGMLQRERDGLAYVYTPVISEDEFVNLVVQQVLSMACSTITVIQPSLIWLIIWRRTILLNYAVCNKRLVGD
jgi:predicted transcriptional regulator